MQNSENGAIYLKYKKIDDMLKVIFFSAQSALGLTPLLHYINYKGQDILFIQTGGMSSPTIHYVIQSEKPTKKFIQLERLTGGHSFVDKVGTDSHSLYLPVLELEFSTLEFPQ